MSEDRDDLDEDQEYRPDPTALRVAARVIQRRASLFAGDAETATDLLDYATEYSGLAARLEDQCGMDCLFEAHSGPADSEICFLETEEFVGFAGSVQLKAIGMEQKSFRLMARDSASGEQAHPAAVVELMGRPKGRWEILHAEVEPGLRRKGVATMLYDCVEEFLGADLGPSCWLSEDAYAFWLARKPEAVAGHRRMEPFLQLWISPGQMLNLMMIDRSKIEALVESANEDIAEGKCEEIARRPN